MKRQQPQHKTTQSHGHFVSNSYEFPQCVKVNAMVSLGVELYLMIFSNDHIFYDSYSIEQFKLQGEQINKILVNNSSE